MGNACACSPSPPLSLAADDMKDQIEKKQEAAVASMRKIVDTALMKLPNKIKTMTMKEFLTQFGGNISAVVSQQIKDDRKLRTTLRGNAQSARVQTILKGGSGLSSRTAGAAAGGAAGGLTAGSGLGLGLGLSKTTAAPSSLVRGHGF